MLYELHCRDPNQRWFSDEYFDLFLWLDEAGRIRHFQLPYAKNTPKERVVEWRRWVGLAHHGVDDGEDEPGKMKASPILVADGQLDTAALLDELRARSANLPKEITDFVIEKIENGGPV
jgi:hypothetical protein